MASLGSNLGPAPPSNMGPPGSGTTTISGGGIGVGGVPSSSEPAPPPTPTPAPPVAPSPPESPVTRRPVTRGYSTKDQIKNYVKRETALFFGVEENQQEEQSQLWHQRRLRLAERRYGPLRVDNACDAEIRYRFEFILFWNYYLFFTSLY